MNNNAKIKNKITVRSLNILIPNFNKAFFISLILNDQETLQSPVYEAKKSKIELNYTYILNSDTVKEIKFVIYEKSTSNPIFKGQSMINDIKISEQEKCSFMYLNDNSNEWSAMIYFNIDLASENNMFDYFQNKLPSGIVSGLDLNKINNQTNDLKIEKESGFSGFFSNLIGKEKEKEKEKNTKTSSFSTTPESASHLSFLSKLAKFAKKDNFETSNSFVKNMNYPITITNILFNLFTWKNYFHTISFLFVASIMILMPDFFFVSIPIILIFLHFCYRESLSLISLKSSEFDSIDGMNYIATHMKGFNNLVNLYHDLVDEYIKADGIIAEELYVEMIKFSFWGYILVILRRMIFYEFQYILLSSLWIFTLICNEYLVVFLLFFQKLIGKRILKPISSAIFHVFPKWSNIIYEKVELILKYFFSSLPIYNLIIKIRNQRLLYQQINSTKENKNILSNLFSNDNSNNSDLKFAKVNPAVYGLDTSKKSLFDVKEIVDGLKSTALENQGIISTPRTSNLNLEIINFEIYENERWWMIVGWAKNLVLNEVPLWSDINFKNYMDKNTVLLPSNDYVWESDWIIKFSDNSDDQGWEYSSDFKSNFTSDSVGKYVRRRKWVRTSKKRNIN